MMCGWGAKTPEPRQGRQLRNRRGVLVEPEPRVDARRELRRAMPRELLGLRERHAGPGRGLWQRRSGHVMRECALETADNPSCSRPAS